MIALVSSVHAPVVRVPILQHRAVKAEPSPAPSLPPRTRLDSRDVRMDFGRQGSFSSVGDGFTLGEDFGMVRTFVCV